MLLWILVGASNSCPFFEKPRNSCPGWMVWLAFERPFESLKATGSVWLKVTQLITIQLCLIGWMAPANLRVRSSWVGVNIRPNKTRLAAPSQRQWKGMGLLFSLRKYVIWLPESKSNAYMLGQAFRDSHLIGCGRCISLWKLLAFWCSNSFSWFGLP